MNIATILNFIYNLHNLEVMSSLEPQKNLDDYAKDNNKDNSIGKAEDVCVGFSYTNYKNDLVKKIIKTKTDEKSGTSGDKNKCNDFNINYAQLEKLYSVAKNNK